MDFSQILLLCISCWVGNMPLVYLECKSGNSKLFLGKYPMSKNNADPININTEKAQLVDTSFPFTIHGKASEPVNVHNNGKSVEVIRYLPTTDSYITGGVLGRDIYLFKKKIYLWTNDTDGNAGTTVDGQRYPLDDTAIFYNKKYHIFENALNQPDGLVKIIFLIKTCPVPNLLFEFYSPILKQVSQAGSSAQTTLGNSIAWFAGVLPLNSDYYVYPGSYIDDSTGQQYDGIPVIVIPHIPIEMCMSENQYKETFGSFKDFSKQTLTNAKSQHSSEGRPILRAKGILNIVIP